MSPTSPNCDCFNRTSNCVTPVSPYWYGNSKNLGFMLFVMQWPPAYCLKSPLCNPITFDTLEKEWNIHGLWPNYNVNNPILSVSPYPACCHYQGLPNQRGSDAFSSIRQKSVEVYEYLQLRWPDVTAKNWSMTSPKNLFIEYEFNKHGTCAMEFYYKNHQNRRFADTTPEEMYFIDALTMLDIFAPSGFNRNAKKFFPNLRNQVLNSTTTHDITLGNLDFLISKFNSWYGNGTSRPTFVLTCFNRIYLLEIRICFGLEVIITNVDLPFPIVGCPSDVLTVSPNEQCSKTELIKLARWKLPVKLA